MQREARGCRGRHGDVEGGTETSRAHRDVERHTETPSDFGQAFAQGQAPRPKGEGLDHERKGWS